MAQPSNRAAVDTHSAVRKAMLLLGGSRIGGAEKRFARAFVALSQKDANVSLIVNDVLRDSLVEHGVPLNRVRNVIVVGGGLLARTSFLPRVISSVRLAFRIIGIIRSENIRFLHSMGFLLIVNAVLFIRLKDVRKGVSLFDSDVDTEIRGNPLMMRLFRIALRRADFAEFLSEDIKKKFIPRYGSIFQGTFHVAPCSFVDYSSIGSVDIRKEDVAVFLARLVPEKNPVLFIKAVRLALNAPSVRPGLWKFYIAGRGHLKPALEKLVADLRLGDYIVFTYEYDSLRLLASSKIFVSLQNVNNYPSQSLIEAMACGNAVIATDVGETSKLVNDETGIRIKPTAEALADAIIALITDPEKIERLGNNGRELVLREHTIERFSEYLLREVYRNV